MLELVARVIALIFAITIHEASHAYMAYRLGDPTAKIKGRLTLNPLAHLDIYGTVIIPLILILTRAPFMFGWAKPVEFDPYNLRNPRRDSALISLAGPASNLVGAFFLSIILHLVGYYLLGSTLSIIIIEAITTNVILAFFNLIPIHPLDGGKIFIGLLPADQASEADRFLSRFGIIILFFLIFPTSSGTSPIFMFLSPILSFVISILLPGNGVI